MMLGMPANLTYFSMLTVPGDPVLLPFYQDTIEMKGKGEAGRKKVRAKRKAQEESISVAARNEV